MSERWATWATRVKRLVWALVFVNRDPRTPRLARIVSACVVAYAFSPIDLIPDPIPVIGYLDDLILVPLGLTLAIRMIPAKVLAECREKAKELSKKPVNRVAAVVVVAVWLALAALGFYLVAGVVR